MAETMAEILSPLFLPLVRQKYLSVRQKTNTERVAIDHIVGADIVNQQVVDSGLSSLSSI